MRQIFNWAISRRFIRYVGVSVVALCVDYTSYWILATFAGITLPLAAVIGYGIGLMASYVLLVAYVFKNGWLRKNRKLEAIFFILSGVFGSVLTFITVSFYVKTFGQYLHGSKLAAVAISFIGVYLFRNYLVFKDHGCNLG